MRKKERLGTHKIVLGPHGNMLETHKLVLALHSNMLWTHGTVFERIYFGNDDAMECLYGLLLRLLSSRKILSEGSNVLGHPLL